MKKKIITAVCYILIFAVVFSITGWITGFGKNSVTAAATVSSKAKESYLLKAYNGNIAVFYGSSADTPVIETSIKVEGLRDVDKKLLSQGIEVEKYDDVLKLLEDYGS